MNRPGFCGNFLRWKDDLHAPQTRGGLVAEHGSEYETEYAEIRSVVAKLAAELDWPPATFVSFIDEHKSVFGVEPICRLLTQHGAPIAPSTCYAAKSRTARPWAGQCGTRR
ncbi:MAG TPA: hypothetical protein VF940_04895 [Streptosporangiaceae bacterium]